LSPGEIVVISAGEIIWAKLLLVLFFFASAIILFRIAKIIHPNSSGRQSVAVWSYVLSPFALFSFGVFSQYDIIGVVFTLAAVYMFLQKRLFGFAVLIGFALTFKFFAALLVAPLLLLANKKFLQIVIYGMISAFPVVIQFAMYWSNDAFRGRIFTQLTSKAGGASTSWEAYAAVAAYFGILVAAYFSNKWPGSFEKKTVLFILSSYGMLLSVVVWHPQWVIILTPFIALAVSFLSRPGLWMLWEAVAFVAYVGYVVTFFKGNVDGVMIQRGALSSLFSEPTFFVADFYPLVLGSTLLLVTEFFFISAALALLINIFHLPKGKFQLPGFSYSVRILMLWAAFIVPAFLAIYLPAETVIWS
jgi:hypothetical protein